MCCVWCVGAGFGLFLGLSVVGLGLVVAGVVGGGMGYMGDGHVVSVVSGMWYVWVAGVGTGWGGVWGAWALVIGCWDVVVVWMCVLLLVVGGGCGVALG